MYKLCGKFIYIDRLKKKNSAECRKQSGIAFFALFWSVIGLDNRTQTNF